jgi:hypothetical protein
MVKDIRRALSDLVWSVYTPRCTIPGDAGHDPGKSYTSPLATWEAHAAHPAHCGADLISLFLFLYVTYIFLFSFYFLFSFPSFFLVCVFGFLFLVFINVHNFIFYSWSQEMFMFFQNETHDFKKCSCLFKTIVC